MKTKSKQIGAILIVVGMIMFSGCCGLFGGGGNPTTTLTGGDGSEVTTTRGGSQVTTTQASGGGGGGGGISLDNLLNLGKPTGYTITYDVTAGGQKMTQTHYFSGQMFRMDMASKMDGKDVETRIYKNADGSFICTKADDAWNCMGGKTEETPTGETGQSVDLDDLSSRLKSADVVPNYEGTRIIAGVTAQCFKADVGGTVSRYCLHSNYNIPLLAESANLAEGQDGYYSMIATSFSAGAPAASTFTLPAEPVDLSNMCKQACGMMPEASQADCMANC
jgi:hypothetical protein